MWVYRNVHGLERLSEERACPTSTAQAVSPTPIGGGGLGLARTLELSLNPQEAPGLKKEKDTSPCGLAENFQTGIGLYVVVVS